MAKKKINYKKDMKNLSVKDKNKFNKEMKKQKLKTEADKNELFSTMFDMM